MPATTHDVSDNIGCQQQCTMPTTTHDAPKFVVLTTNTAADTANFLFHDIVCRFGPPKSIQSYNGPHFADEVIERLTPDPSQFSTPYYPQSNGRAERLIGAVKSTMVKAIEDTDRDATNGKVNWQLAIYTALCVCRASPHHASPAYIL
jgi:transposase InsO family protein